MSCIIAATGLEYEGVGNNQFSCYMRGVNNNAYQFKGGRMVRKIEADTTAMPGPEGEAIDAAW